MKALGIVAIGLLMTLAASCEDRPPTLSIERSSVSAGETVVVHFEIPRSLTGEDAWLTLAPRGGASSPVARVRIPRGLRSASLSMPEPGVYEVALDVPRLGRPHIARARIDVAEPLLSRSDPPVWFW